MSIEITWLGHASIQVRAGKTVCYIDPWKIGKPLPRADIILITHEHYDHYSEDDLELLSNDATRIVAPMSTGYVTDVVKPGQRLALGDVLIEAVPAYNIDKNFHPKENQWVGYVVTLGGKRVYHTGDTDHIPEMKGLQADIVLMPVGGTYTMTAEEAGMALKDLQTDHVIPIHFGDIVGSADDALRLSAISTTAVHILQAGESYTLE